MPSTFDCHVWQRLRRIVYMVFTEKSRGRWGTSSVCTTSGTLQIRGEQAIHERALFVQLSSARCAACVRREDRPVEANEPREKSRALEIAASHSTRAKGSAKKKVS